MKLFFEIKADFLIRSNVRSQLENSKAKILHWFPESRVLLTERKGLFDSEFYFEAVDLPDSKVQWARDWLAKIKRISDEYNN